MIRIGDYYFDAAFSEEHTREAEVTKFPREKGTPATDHRRRMPIQVTIEFGVSDSPIGEALTLRRTVAGLSAPFLSERVLPSEEARAYLEKLDEEGEPVSISTNLRDYDDMLITSIEIDVSPENEGALIGSISFEQSVIIENKRVIVKVREPRAAKKRDLGTGQGKDDLSIDVDPATGKPFGADKDGNLFYVTNEGAPYRRMNEDEIDAMRSYDPNALHVGGDEQLPSSARFDPAIPGWIDSKTGETLPHSPVTGDRYPGDPLDVRNTKRVGNPFFLHSGRGGF